MYKIILIIFSLLIFTSFANAEAIKAGIKYNEASARTEVFKDIQRKIEKDFYRKYKKDPNRVLNIELIKNNTFIVKNSRVLCPFYIKDTLASYAVMYVEEPNYAFYYDILGNLVKFDIVDGNTYPRKIIGYSRFGNLISAALEIDDNEQFVYDENGKLIAHWVGSEVLNKNNKAPRFIKLRRGNN